MVEYDKDHIPDDLINKVKPMLENDETITEVKVAGASKALVPVRIWVAAMITYHEVLKIVNPKRAIAAEKTKELTVVMEKLSVARAKVKAIDDKLAALGAELASLEAKAKALLDEIEDCKKKLVRADRKSVV